MNTGSAVRQDQARPASNEGRQAGPEPKRLAPDASA
ncbi:hypothetical protein SAMN04488082_105173 [Desulfomicrobium apsheronum]|uniref:Uncharacterized protein n=1 Tax=Desulfomicrobium apsheronum TaxID=52560 RepID=A0A1I3TFR4_9BACT|nr:hypothetical protein SAMN04488082_105173 [Desulfomicrobium apsheronum]